MNYLSELIGSFIFSYGECTYMSNITLKNTLIGKLNYIELVIDWGLSVGFGLTVAIILGGPAYLNPRVHLVTLRRYPSNYLSNNTLLIT